MSFWYGFVENIQKYISKFVRDGKNNKSYEIIDKNIE